MLLVATASTALEDSSPCIWAIPPLYFKKAYYERLKGRCMKGTKLAKKFTAP